MLHFQVCLPSIAYHFTNVTEFNVVLRLTKREKDASLNRQSMTKRLLRQYFFLFLPRTSCRLIRLKNTDTARKILKYFLSENTFSSQSFECRQ